MKEMVCFLKEPKSYKEDLYQEETLPASEILDFSDIRGQESLKRAVEIAVSGFHNLLMIGPPGAGRAGGARPRIPGILPPLTLEESLELTKIYSIAGLLSSTDPLIRKRPFRSPHHTSSAQALAGGGRNPRPGRDYTCSQRSFVS